MEYKMRKLKTKDIFKMSKILKKLDLKLSDVNIEEGTTQTQAGITLIQKALENLHRAEDEVNEFLGDLVGLSGEEFGELDIEESINIIMLFKEQKGVANFLNKAEQLTK